MEAPKDGNNSKEPNKTICNRCMSDMTGLPDVPKSDGFDMDTDLEAVLEHMEFALNFAAESVKDNNISTSMIYHSYLGNDIELLRTILGLNGECECCKEHGNDDDMESD